MKIGSYPVKNALSFQAASRTVASCNRPGRAKGSDWYAYLAPYRRTLQLARRGVGNKGSPSDVEDAVEASAKVIVDWM